MPVWRKHPPIKLESGVRHVDIKKTPITHQSHGLKSSDMKSFLQIPSLKSPPVADRMGGVLIAGTDEYIRVSQSMFRAKWKGGDMGRRAPTRVV